MGQLFPGLDARGLCRPSSDYVRVCNNVRMDAPALVALLTGHPRPPPPPVTPPGEA